MFDPPALVSFRSRTSRLKARTSSSPRTARTTRHDDQGDHRTKLPIPGPGAGGSRRRARKYPRKRASLPGRGGAGRHRPRRRLALCSAFFFGSLHGRPDRVREIGDLPAPRPGPRERSRGRPRRFGGAGLHALGLRGPAARPCVVVVADSLSPDVGGQGGCTDRWPRLERPAGLSSVQIDQRLLHEDNLSLYYLTGPPTPAAQAAIGRCVYLVHYNRIASALGLVRLSRTPSGRSCPARGASARSS